MDQRHTALGKPKVLKNSLNLINTKPDATSREKNTEQVH